VVAVAKAGKVSFELITVAAFFEDAPTPGRQEIFIPLAEFRALLDRNDFLVPTALTIQAGLTRCIRTVYSERHFNHRVTENTEI
jgi:hypothetical protein